MVLEDDFSRFAGEMAEQLSFNRSIGQIYGLLYIVPQPLSLDEIARRLGMSKGNASINLRVLESWGAVKPVWVSGTRKDHYEANRDIRNVALRRVQEGFSRRLDVAGQRIEEILTRANGTMTPPVRKNLQDLRALVGNSQRILKMLPKLLKLIRVEEDPVPGAGGFMTEERPTADQVLSWLDAAALAKVATADYWNDAGEEAKKEFDIRDGNAAKLVDYLKVRTNYWRQLEEGISWARVAGFPLRGSGLDAAAGACWTTARLSAEPAIEKVYALDISRNRLLTLAPLVLKLFAAREEKVWRVVGSFYDVRLPAGSLDFCLLSQAYHHADDPGRLLRELARVLRPGGALLVVGEEPVTATAVAVRWAKNQAKRALPRALYARPPAPGLFPSFRELFPPDAVLGDHFYRLAEYRRTFAEGGFRLLERPFEGGRIFLGVRA